MRKRPWPVGIQLVAIIGFLVLILGALGAGLAYRDFRDARRIAGIDTAYQAGLAATAVADSVEEVTRFMTATVADPTLAPQLSALVQDIALCTLQGSGTGVFPEGFIHLIDPNGTILCSSFPTPRAGQASLAGFPWFAQMKESPQAVGSPSYLDPVTGRLTISVGGIVRDERRRVIAGLVASMPLDLVAGRLTQVYGGRNGFTFLLTDAAGRSVLSSSEAPAFAGKTLDRSGIASEGSAVAGLDGVRRIYRGAQASGTGWRVFAGVEEATALAGAQAELRRLGLVGAIAIVAALLLGTMVNRRIARPLRVLNGAIAQASREVLPEPLIARGPAEVVQLVDSFNAMVRARADTEARLSHSTFHDALTDLPNRIMFVDRLRQALRRSGERSLAVLFVDIDRFKIVNDAVGHRIGDLVLGAVAERVDDVVRPGDTVARFGGDEFAVLCDGPTSHEQAAEVAVRIQRSLLQPIRIEGTEVRLTASIGIAMSADPEADPDQLLREADTAMSQAKAGGKARHEFFRDAQRHEALARLELEGDLRKAVRDGSLTLAYQPMVELASGRIRGVEALLRWQHPTRGAIPPATFIPIAEETGLILPLGRLVLERACRQAVAWHAAGLSCEMSVNVSARQLALPDFPAVVAEVLDDSGLDPASLCLEITESVLIADGSDVADALRSLKALGVKLSIDDFGTGFSSLSYLQRFPIDQLKMDRVFIERLRHGNTALVGAIVSMARALDLEVVGEGVEEEEQAATLRQLGCDIAQGYLYARPGTAAAVEEACRVGIPALAHAG